MRLSPHRVPVVLDGTTFLPGPFLRQWPDFPAAPVNWPALHACGSNKKRRISSIRLQLHIIYLHMPCLIDLAELYGRVEHRLVSAMSNRQRQFDFPTALRHPSPLHCGGGGGGGCGWGKASGGIRLSRAANRNYREQMDPQTLCLGAFFPFFLQSFFIFPPPYLQGASSPCIAPIISIHHPIHNHPIHHHPIHLVPVFMVANYIISCFTVPSVSRVGAGQTGGLESCTFIDHTAPSRDALERVRLVAPREVGMQVRCHRGGARGSSTLNRGPVID